MLGGKDGKMNGRTAKRLSRLAIKIGRGENDYTRNGLTIRCVDGCPRDAYKRLKKAYLADYRAKKEPRKVVA